MLFSNENFLGFSVSCIWFLPQNTDLLKTLIIGQKIAFTSHKYIEKKSFLRSCFYAKAFRYIHVILFLARIKFPIFLFKQQQVCVIESLWRVWSVHDTRTVFSCNELIFTKNWSDVIFLYRIYNVSYDLCITVYFLFSRLKHYTSVLYFHL